MNVTELNDLIERRSAILAAMGESDDQAILAEAGLSALKASPGLGSGAGDRIVALIASLVHLGRLAGVHDPEVRARNIADSQAPLDERRRVNALLLEQYAVDGIRCAQRGDGKIWFFMPSGIEVSVIPERNNSADPDDLCFAVMPPGTANLRDFEGIYVDGWTAPDGVGRCSRRELPALFEVLRTIKL